MANSSSSSSWRRWSGTACVMVLAAACLLGSASAARHTRGRFGPPVKQVWTASPGNLSTTMASCYWDGYSCASSMAPIFAKGAPTISPENFPARANAFIQAGDFFCSQFSESNCSYPCQMHDTCQLNDASYYQVLNCPGSVLYDEITCLSPPQQSAASCLVQPGCSYTTTRPDDVCTSTYAANLTDSQAQYVFGDLEFNVMPKQLLGCCKGSVYKYQINNWCDAAFDGNGMSSPALCAKVPGCMWNINTADGCVVSPQTDIKLQFAYKPSDAIAPVLSTLGGECAAIKDEATCNVYKPVEVDAQKVKLYLGISQRYNSPVADKECPLPSVQLPNM